MTVTDTERQCGICGLDQFVHRQREAQGQVNHVWNADGDLIQVKREPAKPAMPTIMIVDAELREVLLRKGVITVEDFTALRDSRPGPAGDRGTGSTERTG